MFIWIGQSVSPTDISSIWGVNTPMEVLDGPIPTKDTENNSTLRMVFLLMVIIVDICSTKVYGPIRKLDFRLGKFIFREIAFLKKLFIFGH